MAEQGPDGIVDDQDVLIGITVHGREGGVVAFHAALQDIGYLPEIGCPNNGADLGNEFRLGDDDHLVNPGMGFENARRMLQDRLSGEFQELFRTIAPEPGAASARQDDTYSFHIPLK